MCGPDEAFEVIARVAEAADHVLVSSFLLIMDFVWSWIFCVCCSFVAKVNLCLQVYIAFGFRPGVRMERLCVRRHSEATKLEKVRVLTSQFSE